jgi:Ca2+-binding RTX toxin-like protein
LGEESQAILSEVLGQISGTTSYVTVGDATAIYVTTAPGFLSGAIAPMGGSVVGTYADINFQADLDLPANIGINFQGPQTDSTVDAAATFFDDLINAALPVDEASDPAVQAKAQSLQTAVDVIKNVATDGTASVRYLELTNANPDSATGEVKISGVEGANEVVAINAAQLGTQQQLILENLDKVILVNDADVVVTGTQPALVVGDDANQKITGGQGADTLVGGGGSDTLVGGAGDDTFGFSSGGLFQIGDFDRLHDTFAFSIPNITTFADLAKLVTGVQETGEFISFEFGTAGTITLMGLTASDITADLIRFTLD